MPVDTTKLMVGAGDFYTFPVGYDDSLIIATASPTLTGLTYMGATDGGVNLTVAKSYANHTVDQTADWVASTITERSARVETNLAEVTHQNLALALNGGTTASTVSWDTYTPVTDLIVSPETYVGLAVVGNTFAGKKRIVVIRKALNIADVAFAFQKDAKTMYGVSWAGHYVSQSLAPFVVYTQH